MGGDALLFEHGHEPVAHLIVDHALAGDGALLQAIEGGGVVLVLHDQQFGVVGLEYFLGFSFVQLFQFLHR